MSFRANAAACQDVQSVPCSRTGLDGIALDTAAAPGVLALSLDSLVTALSREDRYGGSAHSPRGGPRISTSALEEDVRNSPRQALAVARALAQAMRIGSREAKVAAALYSRLRLPSGPANSLALDRRLPPYVRTAALHSTRLMRSDAQRVTILIAVACDYRARVASRVVNASEESLQTLLDSDEWELGWELAGDLASLSKSDIARVAQAIGLDNVIIKWARSLSSGEGHRF